MKNLRNKFNRFCFQNRDKGIHNLMLYISLACAVVYVVGMVSGNHTLYNLLCFDRTLILRGQVWRLFSYVLTYGYGDYRILLVAIGLFCYFSLGQAIENTWGAFRFNLFYLCGILLQDIFCLIFGGAATVGNLNLTLFLAYATMYPNAQFLLFFIIPVKAWIFAVIDLAITLYDVTTMTMMGYFPYSLFPFVALLNYFLFFGKDVVNVFPASWRINASRLFRRGKTPKKASGPKVVPFPTAGSYEATTAKVQAPYTHRCTICGRTDTSDPKLEFRYCSRCSGYHCYCEDHISNHTHIE